MNQKTPENESLYNLGKRYLDLRLQYLRLLAIEKGSHTLGAILLILVCILLAGFALLTMSFALAYLLGNLLGNFIYGFALVSLIYLVIIGILILFKDILVINPLIRLFDSVILPNTDTQNETTQPEEEANKQPEPTQRRESESI